MFEETWFTFKKVRHRLKLWDGMYAVAKFLFKEADTTVELCARMSRSQPFHLTVDEGPLITANKRNTVTTQLCIQRSSD